MEKGLVFGLSIGDLLEIYDHDLRSWKMSGCLFTGDYAKSSGPLRKSGIMLNGRIYEQATWARRTGGKESGLLPTPVNYDATPGGPNNHYKGLGHQAKFPTPHSSCHTGAGKRGDGGENLQTAVMWPTPTASDAKTHPNDCKRFQSLDVTIRENKTAEIAGGQLNPTWVCWLMGYPLNWLED